MLLASISLCYPDERARTPDAAPAPRCLSEARLAQAIEDGGPVSYAALGDPCAFHPLLLLWVIGHLGYSEEREMSAKILWELGFCALLALGTPVIPLKLPFPSVSFSLCAGSRKGGLCMAWHGL